MCAVSFPACVQNMFEDWLSHQVRAAVPYVKRLSRAQYCIKGLFADGSIQETLQ